MRPQPPQTTTRKFHKHCSRNVKSRDGKFSSQITLFLSFAENIQQRLHLFTLSGFVEQPSDPARRSITKSYNQCKNDKKTNFFGDEISMFVQ